MNDYKIKIGTFIFDETTGISKTIYKYVGVSGRDIENALDHLNSQVKDMFPEITKYKIVNFKKTMIIELLSSFILLSGKASYYSTTGCLGCNQQMIMANGEKLDDSKFTLALTPSMVRKYKLLNKKVIVENIDNGMLVEAKVTDTGGFAKYNRVADLSLATKKSIKCKDLCNVQILIIK